jgi:L-histidine Nalpha-methyltransferase
MKLDSAARFRADLVRGLALPQKRIPSRYFYDAVGSQLFDQITELPEYYLTRTELGILGQYADAMAGRLGSRCLLIEPGAGSLVKVRYLLDRMAEPAGFVPVDVSADHLTRAATALQARYPCLAILPVCADFTAPFSIPKPPRTESRRAIFFPGSTLGNFGPAEADDLLTRFARMVGPGGSLLLGLDLQKDPATIEAAYNDRRGVTAAFNLNVLARANRELGADFDLDNFRHQAFYDPTDGRIEMHLESLADQAVRVAGAAVRFRAGETIHTEDSYKYDLDAFARRAAACGWQADATWTDARRAVAVLHLTAAGVS